MNRQGVLAGAAALVAGVGLAGAALAEIGFDQFVTPDVIFGSGNANGEFTTDRRNGIEIGLLAKIPFVGTINSFGDGTYSYTLAETDHDSDGGAVTARRWNFDWTVNTDFDNSSVLVLDDLTYEMGLDADPGLGVNFFKFDPITPGVAPLFAPFFDHSIGDNSSTELTDTKGTAANYSTLLATKNVAQNSWRFSFFDSFAPLNTYDPDISGTYAVYVLAKDANGEVVARSDIQVLIEGASPAGQIVECNGFEPPLDTDVSVNKPNRVLPLRMALVDSYGVPLTGDDIVVSPVVQVTFDGIFTGTADLEELDTAGKGDDGNMFTFDGSNWAFNMKTRGLASGNYTVTAVSGDLAEYVIDPTCSVNISIQ